MSRDRGTGGKAKGLTGRFAVAVWCAAVPCLAAAAPIHPAAGSRASAVLAARPGVRSAAMGGASAGVADDFSAIWANPAGLGNRMDTELGMARRSLAEEVFQDVFGLVMPTGGMSAGNVASLGAFGVGMLSHDFGSLVGRDAAGAPIPSFEAKDVLWTLGYGKSVGPLSVGAAIKRYRLALADQVSRGKAWDAGVLYTAEGGRLSLGFAASNLGPASGFVGREADLPRSVSGGAAFRPVKDLLLAVDVENPSNGDHRYRAGAEFWAAPLFALRAGAFTGDPSGPGLSFGAGLRLREFEFAFFPVQDLFLDYAFVPSSDFRDSHSVALRLRFGEK